MLMEKNDNYRVAVIMSTYNGEKYVEEQIQSIFSQINVSVYLYIRDDGSSDKTLSIIEKKMENNCQINLWKENNIGVGNSFMNALYRIPDDYDYFAFSDQDDIWDEEKLYKAIEMILDSKKQLYVSNQKCVDRNGKFICFRYDKASNPLFQEIDVLCHNNGTGCTMVFTKNFKHLLCEENRHPSEKLLQNRIHDVWVTMVAVVTNNLVYDSNAYINYRQHENNVVGIYKPGLTRKIKIKIEKIKDEKKRRGRSALAEEIIKCYGDFVMEKSILHICANYRNNIKDRIKLIKEYHVFIKYNNPFVFSLYVVLALF